MSLSNVTIVIVTFNSAHCIDALADGLFSCPNLIVVDNASSDDTPNKVRSRLPHAKLIIQDNNQGFGAANNRALRTIDTPFALLLNPDCLATGEAICNLLRISDLFPDAAIIAPHLIRRDGQLEISYRWPRKSWISTGPEATGPCCVGFATGATLLLNMEKMRTVEFFDETFFLYYEDEDLCQRVFNHRFPIVIAPEVKLTHLSRGSVRGRNPLRSEFIRGYHHAQSKLLFEHKHVSAESARQLRWKTLGLALLTLIPRLLLPQPKYLARLAGRIAGLCRDYPQPRS